MDGKTVILRITVFDEMIAGIENISNPKFIFTFIGIAPPVGIAAHVAKGSAFANSVSGRDTIKRCGIKNRITFKRKK